MKNKKLILIELNEINFDKIKYYFEKYNLKNIKKLFSLSNIKTSSEKEYSLLEPWIQWASAHTGLNAKEHKILHLGDIQKFKTRQIFEEVEKFGYTVGAISPMNTLNNLKKPKYFIPDPWTETSCDKNNLSNRIKNILSKTVKDNSSLSFSFPMILEVLIIFFLVVRVKRYFLFLKIFLHSLKKKWFKVIFLDLLINEIHLNYFKKFKPNFSTVFFNGGAHIQHHYFLSSKALKKSEKKNPKWYIKENDDPLKDIVKYYDIILSDYFDMRNTNLIIATALRQVPIKKPEYYWKLKNYENFLNFFEIPFDRIQQLMSRDFVIHFDFKNKNKINECFKVLRDIYVVDKDKKTRAFETIEKREESIFVSLTFSNELTKGDYFISENKEKKMKCLNNVNFVAIKNGIHNSSGYLFTNIKKFQSKENMHVKNIFNLIINFFGREDEKNKV